MGKQPKSQLIFIAGDLHGDWDRFNHFIDAEIRQSQRIRKLACDFAPLELLILQTGDFGFWPHKHGAFTRFLRTLLRHRDIKNAMPGILDGRIKIYWCDGNHENHDALDKLEVLKAPKQARSNGKPAERFIEIMPGVYFSPFGSVLRLLDGTTVLFCGGADSIDKARRTLGKSWWVQETIDENDMAQLPPPDSLTVDWVISHTCPLDFDVRSGSDAKEADPSKRFLDTVLAVYRPKRWWFGHYHDYQTGEFAKCAWTLLSRIGDPKGKTWVLELPLLERNCGNEKPK